jgi:hypothetical protein
MIGAKLLVLVGVALQLAGSAATAAAQCIVFDKPEDLFARADVVFRGPVVATEPAAAEGAHAIVEVATFRVEESWKGRPAREVRVGTDRPFQRGKKYVVFAAGKPLTTSVLCGWAELEERAKTQLAWLANHRKARGNRGKSRLGLLGELLTAKVLVCRLPEPPPHPVSSIRLWSRSCQTSNE